MTRWDEVEHGSDDDDNRVKVEEPLWYLEKPVLPLYSFDEEGAVEAKKIKADLALRDCFPRENFIENGLVKCSTDRRVCIVYQGKRPNAKESCPAGLSEEAIREITQKIS